ncbi:MAG: NUDIX hydrolase [Hyphomicrobiales bacterium]
MPQVGALPWRARNGAIEILLVTSRATGRWVIPKGGIMPHLVDMNAARQEAFEEAGIVGHMRRKRIGAYTYRKLDLRGPSQLCRVKVFALKVERELQYWPEMAQRRRRWFTVKDAVKRVGERDLRKIMQAFAEAVTTGKAE